VEPGQPVLKRKNPKGHVKVKLKIGYWKFSRKILALVDKKHCFYGQEFTHISLFAAANIHVGNFAKLLFSRPPHRNFTHCKEPHLQNQY
jgi:hypothetical protein